MLITGDAEVASLAAAAGVDRLFVDLETLGKQERQGHLDTHKAQHTVETVRTVREAAPNTELLVRTNPVHDGTAAEVNAVIEAGAEWLMLPMFRSPEEVATFTSSVAGRAKVMLLLETATALARVDQILDVPGIDAIHVGLNDLHLEMKLTMMFELLSGGMVEFVSNRVLERGIAFGFGGVARIGTGELPAELVVSEHVRLGSTAVILSRAFHQRAETANDFRERFDLGEEIAKVRAAETEFKNSHPSVLKANQARVIEIVEQIRRRKALG